MAEKDGGDFLIDTLKTAAKVTAVVAAVAFLGDDIGNAITNMGGEVKGSPTTWQSIASGAGGLFTGASNLAAGGISWVANAVTDPMVGASNREFTAADFQSITGATAKAAENILGSSGTAIRQGATYATTGLTGAAGEMWEGIKDSAAAKLIVEHPGQAAAVAAVGGAAAEVVGRWTARVAKESTSTTVNVNPMFRS